MVRPTMSSIVQMLEGEMVLTNYSTQYLNEVALPE
jgi:hypothetical protein